MQPRYATSGFTLIELLVVISIIVLLISLLLPALGRSRESAYRAQCMSNQRQLLIAFQGYADTHKGRAMEINHTVGEYWFFRLQPYTNYVDEVRYCPIADTKNNAGGIGTASDPWSYQGKLGNYGLNLWFTPYGAFQNDPIFPRDNYFYNVFGMPFPDSEAPVFGDSPWVGSWPSDFDFIPANTFSPPQPHAPGFFMSRFCIDRHDFGIVVAFLDGHADHVQLNELWSLRWSRNYVPTKKERSDFP